jgi:lipopolysaccharide transport system ATP-binding protein
VLRLAVLFLVGRFLKKLSPHSQKVYEMNPVALEFDGIWKKFKRGERHDSLRDLIPATVKGLLSKNVSNQLRDREFWALQDVSFQIKRGEAVGIIGPNGSGKSTTLKILSGILKPNRGQFRVSGRLSALIEVAAGFHPDLTGRENVYLNGTILGMTKLEIDKKFDEIVEFSGLEEFIDTPVKRYSSGMFARLGFSVAAHVDPEILLVDEVLSVGDMSFQQRCMEKLQEKLRSDVAVVFVSHNLPAVSSLCSRAILINKGSLVADGPCSETLESYVSAVSTANAKTSLNSQIEIVRVGFTTDGSLPPSMISPHTACQLLVTFRCKAEMPPFNIGLIIRRTQDLFYCYGATTQELGQPLYTSRPGDVFTLRFDFDAHFTRGHYRVDLNVRDPKTARMMLESDGVASFAIDEDVTYSGVTDIGLKASPMLIQCARPAVIGSSELR